MYKRPQIHNLWTDMALKTWTSLQVSALQGVPLTRKRSLIMPGGSSTPGHSAQLQSSSLCFARAIWMELDVTY